MNAEGQRFLALYDDMSAEVTRAGYQTFSLAIQQWLSAIETEPRAAPVLAAIEAKLDFPRWYGASPRMGGMAGSGVLPWPTEADLLLAARLGLVRSFAGSFQAVVEFSLNYMYSGPEFDSMASKVADQVFRPAARDLRRNIALALENAPAPPPLIVPAADRTVTVDHNRPEFPEMIAAVERVERALHEANDYEDADDKQQRLAELAAGRQVLDAPKARWEVVKTVLGGALKFLAFAFGTVLLGVLANAAWLIIEKFFSIS